MSVSVESYYHISEKQKRLAEIYEKNKEKAIFIVPSGMDKEYLLDLISDNGSFLEERPKIWVWSDLYNELNIVAEVSPRHVLDPTDHLFILKHLLNLFVKETKNAGLDLPPGVERHGFVKILGENIRDLLLEGVLPETLTEKISETEGNKTSPEAILYRLYSDYLSYLEKNNLLDSAQIATETSKLLNNTKVRSYSKEHKFVFIGFLTFTGGQLNLVKHSFDKEVEKIFILPNSGLEYRHDSIKQISDYKGYKEKTAIEINYMELNASNAFLQFNAIARELALWLHDKSDLSKIGGFTSFGDIGIQVQEKRLKILKSALSRYKIPYNLQVRENVGETLLGELPKLIWSAYSSNWDTHETLLLLSSPLIHTEDFNFKNCLKYHPQGQKKWELNLKNQEKMLKVFKRIIGFCSEIRTGGSPVTVLSTWRDFILDLDITNKIGPLVSTQVELDSEIKNFAYSIRELERKIKTVESSDKNIKELLNVFLSGSDAINYILDWNENAKLPMPLQQNGSVTVYVGSPPVLAEHRYWIMTDVDYDTWPGKFKESPLLSDENKEKINNITVSDVEKESDAFVLYLPNLHDKREQRESLFRRLIATGVDGIIFTRSLNDSNARPVGKAQFLESIKTNYPAKGEILYPLLSLTPDKNETWFSGAEVSEGEKKIDRDRMPRKVEWGEDFLEKTVSLSSLDEWIKCPYRYWCKSVLGLEKTRTDLFDPLSAGSFVHKLWELSWLEYQKNNKQSFVILSKKYWDKAAEEYPNLIKDGRLKRQADRLKKQVESVALLLDKIEKNMSGRTNVEIESWLPELDVGGVKFRGRLDRADIFESEDVKRMVILDYKLGDANKHKDDWQLAAYSIIKQGKGYRPIGYAWVGHKSGTLCGYFIDNEIKEVYEAKNTNKELDDLLKETKEHIHDMAESIKKGIYEADYNSLACSRYCEFYTICRKKEAVSYDLEEGEDDNFGGGCNE